MESGGITHEPLTLWYSLFDILWPQYKIIHNPFIVLWDNFLGWIGYSVSAVGRDDFVDFNGALIYRLLTYLISNATWQITSTQRKETMAHLIFRVFMYSEQYLICIYNHLYIVNYDSFYFQLCDMFHFYIKPFLLLLKLFIVPLSMPNVCQELFPLTVCYW